MKDPNCVFCKIVSKELPSTLVYEDEHAYAFLDIKPNAAGHTLVIPKKHYPNLYETPDEILGVLMPTARKIAIALKDAVESEGTNIIINTEPAAGQVVFHTHIHVIPRFSKDGFKPWPPKKQYADGEMEKIAEKIKQSLTN